MKYILKKTENNVAVCDKDGNQISKWNLEELMKVGGLDKIIERAKKLYPNIEIDLQSDSPAPAPAPAPAPEPTPEPAPSPAPEPAPATEPTPAE